MHAPLPVGATKVRRVVAARGTATDIESDTGEDEDNDRRELQHRGPELFLCVAERTEDVDEDDGDEEDLRVDEQGDARSEGERTVIQTAGCKPVFQ